MSFAKKIGKLFQRRSVKADEGLGSPLDSAAQGSSLAGDSILSSYADEELLLDEEQIALPLLGRAPASVQQRRLLIMLAAGVIVLALMAGWVLQQTERSAQQLVANGQALMQSQRLAKSASQAMMGNREAFDGVQESADVLARSVRSLASNDAGLGGRSLEGKYSAVLKGITVLMERAEASAEVVLKQKAALMLAGDSLSAVNRLSSELLAVAESISALKLQQAATSAEILAAGQLAMLTQRIGKSANEFQSAEGVHRDAVFLLAKDLSLFEDVAKNLLDGNAAKNLPATRDEQTRAQFQTLFALYKLIRNDATAILGNMQRLDAAHTSKTLINSDSEPLRQQLEALQSLLRAEAGLSAVQFAALGLVGLFVLLCGVGISRVQLMDSRNRQAAAEQQQRDAKRQEKEAKRINDANQAAILRLMNELQSVAEGDLTQEATVTEDITGAIADSVNYTVEELRLLVGSVQNTATRVAQTTSKVDNTSTELLATSTEQLREIRETGRSVLDMATRINQVSTQAQESASVARQSLEAADQGLKAVQNTIGGMNSIRDQIQDTSKRIKRLGESSQEIGEITELISDITEQTNMLALNAAIQAASAGEAGRGFSVVAEEVQRLAERSADATRQISVLVKAIQADTQDAVAAMERSTAGVVQGAQLSDTAGTALSEIDSVSRRLAELIEQISESTSREADLANGVADNIQHIFVVTEQTGEGTRSTAQQVHELSHMAEELRQSVARFKIA